MPPLPRCGPPTWEKEGRTHIPRWTNPSGPAGPPALLLLPAGCVRRQGRSPMVCVCVCVCPVGVTTEVETWEDEEGRKEGRDSMRDTGGQTERERERDTESSIGTEGAKSTCNRTNQMLHVCLRGWLDRSLLLPLPQPSRPGQKGDVTGSQHGGPGHVPRLIWPAGWTGSSHDYYRGTEGPGGTAGPAQPVHCCATTTLLPLGD